MMFKKSFEDKCLGKKEYFSLKSRGDALYGWVACADDYNGKGLIVERLKKMGDLKTVADVEKEEKDKNSKLVVNLRDSLGTKEEQLKVIMTKVDETSVALKAKMQEMDNLIKDFNEKTRKMEQSSRDYMEVVLSNHRKAASDIEAHRKHLLQREQQLVQHEAQNESERQEIQHKKKLNEMATLEQKQADENMLQLAEDQKIEKEKLRKKIIGLEKQLDSKHALELEIERLQGSLQVRGHMEDDDGDRKKKLKQIEEDLKDKEEELYIVEELYHSYCQGTQK